MSRQTHETAGLLDVPVLVVTGTWETVFQRGAKEALEAALPRFLMPRRWFGAKARTMRGIRIVEAVPILQDAYLILIRAEYAAGEPDTYVLPMAFMAGAAAQAFSRERPAAVIATFQTEQGSGILYDAVWNLEFCQALLEAIVKHRQYRGATGDVVATAASVLPSLRGDASQPLPPVLLGVEQSNTSVRYGEQLILKLYRRLELGINPDQEIGQFLTEKIGFANVPPVAGVLEFRRHKPAGGEAITLALLQGFVPNRGDAWHYTLDSLADYFEAARAWGEGTVANLPLPHAPLLELIRGDIPAEAEQFIGEYMASARLLARRTAELHLALVSDPADPVFAPEPFTADFQDTLHRSMRELTDRIMTLLRARFDALPEAGQADARQVLSMEEQIAARFDVLLDRPIHALRSRIHGDYHLGQVLYTGQDFMIIDFEGEPARPLSERRMKRSPLQDVAGMLRSFHYAAYAAYFNQAQDGAPMPELEPWVRFWHLWVSVAYLEAYMEIVRGAALLPSSPEEVKLLLDVYLVEKAVYELGYELNNRPGWVTIPLQGILQTVQAAR
jgi:maltose alpha-D-glucosyltransferase / alpha-amylase